MVLYSGKLQWYSTMLWYSSMVHCSFLFWYNGYCYGTVVWYSGMQGFTRVKIVIFVVVTFKTKLPMFFNFYTYELQSPLRLLRLRLPWVAGRVASSNCVAKGGKKVAIATFL